MSSKIVLKRMSGGYKSGRNTHDWRLASSLEKYCLSDGVTRSDHSHFFVEPLITVSWKVCTCDRVCSLLRALMASVKKSPSGLLRSVSLYMASNKTLYFWRCSTGRFKKCLRSRRGDCPRRVICLLEQVWFESSMSAQELKRIHEPQ